MKPPLEPAVAIVRVLHLEDSRNDADLICAHLEKVDVECAVDQVWEREAYEQALREKSYDLILADYKLPTFDGDVAYDIAKEIAPDVPFIFVSGAIGEDLAVDALKRGVTDYVLKDRLHRLPDVVKRALQEASDKAKRRRAEAALRSSEANFASLVDAMPQLCFMADRTGKLTWFNRQWLEYTGLSAEQALGDGWRATQHPDHVEKVIAAWSEAVRTLTPFEMTFPIKGHDGEYRPFLSRAVPVRSEAGDAMDRWLGTNTDVSAQQRAEEAVRHLNETLETRVVEAVAAKEGLFGQLSEIQKLETLGQLTGGVAHDFNNLLTPIVGNLDLLRRRVGDDEKNMRLVSGAMQGAERAKSLVQRLLAFARRQALEPRAVNVANLIEGVTDMIARTIGPQIEIHVEVKPDLRPARVDPGQLELAVLNLAVNARDAMSGGGRLTIELDAQEATADNDHGLRHGSYVRLSVTDTGSGMDERTMKRAIEPFYSTKGIGKGTGLGLSMVHGLAGQSGGTLVLSSVIGRGTRAEIWLPIADGEATDAPLGAPTKIIRTRRLTILLVDDEDLVRVGTAEMLSDLGHVVIQAGSGAEALEQIRQGLAPDVMITDYLMPGMNGADLASDVRELHPGLKILLATGYANLAGNQMANLPLLPKPFRQAELASRLAALIEPSRDERKRHLRAVD